MTCVIFDLDGTLADTAADLIAAANAALGGELLGSEDQGTALRGGRAMLRLGLARRDGAADTAEIDRLYPVLLAAYDEKIDVHTKIYPGAIEAVREMRARGWRTGICTNKPEGLALKLVNRLGVADLFDSLIGADTLPVRKPDPAPLREAVARTGGDMARTVLIGDTVTDRDTARAARVPVVLVTFGPAGDSVRDLAPDATLARYADLPGIVDSLLDPAPDGPALTGLASGR